MLDPLSALSLTSSIVNLVDFSCKVVSESREIYQSGSIITNDELEQIANDLSGLLQMVKSSQNPTNADSGGRLISQGQTKINEKVKPVLYILGRH